AVEGRIYWPHPFCLCIQKLFGERVQGINAVGATIGVDRIRRLAALRQSGTEQDRLPFKKTGLDHDDDRQPVTDGLVLCIGGDMLCRR
ncbi:MAG: hypothetical protein NXI27_31825, partial [Alphaproteobacteria bacterium]|nr:hypothetical protein [Alphaproteobacteria bacterium]